jgi:hypothetical protein
VQAVGLLTQVEILPVPSADTSGVHRWLIASAELTATHFGLDVQLLAPMTDARALAGTRDDRDVHAVGEEQAMAVLGDLVTVVADRLGTVLQAGGHVVDTGKTRSRGLSNTGGWPSRPERAGLFIQFQNADRTITLGVRLNCWSATPQPSVRPH